MKRINWFLCNQTNVCATFIGWLNDWMTYWLIDWHWWIDIDWQEARDLILLVLKHFEAWNDNLQVLKDKGYVFGRLVGFGGLILASGNTLCSFLAYWGFVDCVWDVCSIYCLCWLRFYCRGFLSYSKLTQVLLSRVFILFQRQQTYYWFKKRGGTFSWFERKGQGHSQVG